jgi:hypothetical protein
MVVQGHNKFAEAWKLYSFEHSHADIKGGIWYELQVSVTGLCFSRA